MIRSRLLPSIVASLSLPGTALAQIAPCPAVVAHRPETTVAAAPTNDVGCERGVRLTVGTATLFRCQVLPAEGQDDIREGSPEYVFLLDRPGEGRVILPDGLMAGRFAAFEVLTVDLDADGQAENVLAAWNGQGMGLGVNRWTVRVFDADWAQIASFEDVADWGDSSLVAAPRGRPGCDLAITAFVDHVDQRGPGTAFRARFHQLDGGAMPEATDRPTLTRRYTYAFQDQRTAHFEAGEDAIKGDVAAWLAHRSTEAE